MDKLSITQSHPTAIRTNSKARPDPRTRGFREPWTRRKRERERETGKRRSILTDAGAAARDEGRHPGLQLHPGGGVDGWGAAVRGELGRPGKQTETGAGVWGLGEPGREAKRRRTRGWKVGVGRKLVYLVLIVDQLQSSDCSVSSPDLRLIWNVMHAKGMTQRFTYTGD